jgi:hypothetical protein
LLHFVLLGAALFALYFYVNDDPLPENPRAVTVDETTLTRLMQTFQRTWMRPPVAEEFAGLIEAHVKEEILYREGLALGLDQNDLIIRRRIQQKFEFLNADLVELAPVTEAELQTYLQDHADEYRQPENISFRQVFISTSESGVDPQQRAVEILESLTSDEVTPVDLDQLGDSIMLPVLMENESQAGIDRVFGTGFAEQLSGAQKGSWSGPYPSGYGLHLVYLSQFTPARESTLEDVRPLVERDLVAERSRNANDQFYLALRKRYSVDVQYPQDEPPGSNSE